MKKPIGIIAGEPNSISSEIIFKSWRFRKKYNHRPFLIIGNINLLNKQKKKLNYKFGIKKIDNNFKLKELNKNKIPVYNVKYNQKKIFQKISNKSNKYIFECFNVALKLIKDKKISGLINCPISKETLFKNENKGITEYLSKKSAAEGKEVMLLFNRKLSVSPLTTHIPLSQISKKINKSKIVSKVEIINNFYKKIFKKKPKFAILGLNPHNFNAQKKSEEK